MYGRWNMKSVDFLKNHDVDVDKSLELFGDMGIYNETMQDFLDGIEEKKSNLKKFKDLNDWADYAIYAHSIKSDARYLGFTKVAEVALQHEMAGKESNQHFIEKDYDNFVSATNNMIGVVKDYLNGSEQDNLTNNEDISSRIITSEGNEEVVLIADDSKLVSNFATKMLSQYKIVSAKDG